MTDIRKPQAAESLADRAYSRLRADILDGDYAPGQPLRLEPLRSRYGYSFSPLREALTRLAADRLVSQSSLRGFRVAELSLDEMWDILRTRILIEGEALRLAIASGDNAWEARVDAALAAFARCVEAPAPAIDDASVAYEQCHAAFHTALIDACGSPSLLRLARQLYLQTERYRRPHLMSDAADSVIAEHRALRDAALARAPETATELLRRHYTRTGHFIEAALAAAPEPAGP
ncbi:FCD domain-containing protein [Paroceanicella profunda]|uniref:FCD domain-containing protein n=1 Tax=Paroceanicella profunda TaxID=2579971 RepID=A0A5B8FXM3_9RHOB|nr:FCD domain-containing protein [Paroceanicella profunda]QDL91289.1 FCD domain-containing protein [Paroceanicella profunda]